MTKSERNVFLPELLLVVKRLLRRLPARRGGLGGAATATAAAASLGTLIKLIASATRGTLATGTGPTATGAAARIIAPAQELEVVHDDADLAALSPAALVLPGVQLQVALDEDRLALLAPLVDHLSLAAPGGAVHEKHFLAVLTAAGLVLSLAGGPELADGGLAGGQIAQLRVARQVSHQKNFVEAGHGSISG